MGKRQRKRFTAHDDALIMQFLESPNKGLAYFQLSILLDCSTMAVQHRYIILKRKAEEKTT